MGQRGVRPGDPGLLGLMEQVRGAWEQFLAVCPSVSEDADGPLFSLIAGTSAATGEFLATWAKQGVCEPDHARSLAGRWKVVRDETLRLLGPSALLTRQAARVAELWSQVPLYLPGAQ